MGWQEIWQKRKSNFKMMNKDDVQAVFLELKRANGFDIVPGENAPSFYDWLHAHEEHKENLRVQTGDSVYEVGCGSGANLFLLAKDGLQVSGTDYSTALLTIAKEVLATYNIEPWELGVCEAKSIPTKKKYDVVFQDGISHYFPDYDYAQETLQRMFEKSRRTVAWLEVHDKAKEEAFFAAREKIDPQYREHYKGLPKLFYPKAFFLQFAEKHGLDICFTPCRIRHYWNAPFTYNVYFYKN